MNIVSKVQVAASLRKLNLCVLLHGGIHRWYAFSKEEKKKKKLSCFPPVARDFQPPLSSCVYANGWELPLAPCEIQDCVAGSESTTGACAVGTEYAGDLLNDFWKIPPCLNGKRFLWYYISSFINLISFIFSINLANEQLVSLESFSLITVG